MLYFLFSGLKETDKYGTLRLKITLGINIYG